ncbi:MAG: hypothetical protein QY322_03655 [bacterium]|nr:MAG: hypothetical protein QY322_03655 [bacterium]
MTSDIKNKVLPAYKELKGLLAQAPQTEKIPNIHQPELWNRTNSLITELVQITDNNRFDEYKLNTKFGYNHEPYVPTDTYRGMLNALIMRLQGEYSLEPQDPFGGSPSTILNQTQTQNTNVQILVQLGMDLQQAMSKTENDNEKSFIEKIKEKIGEIKSYVEFANLIVSLAIQSGITLERLKTLFS